MTKLWVLLMFVLATACNVANEPKPLEGSGVTNDLGSMTLANSSLTRNESSGVVSLVVSISNALDTAVAISYTMSGTTVGGAACTAGVDYIAPSGTLNISAGGRTGVVDITLCADALYEGSENFTLTLTGSSPSLSIGTVASTTVTLLDSSVPPPIAFDLASSGSITEGEVANTVVPVDVELQYPSAFPVTVDILTSGSATLGTDYSLSATQVTFPAGTTTATVFVTVIADTIVELNESIVLSLFNPFGGVIGQVPSHTLQIAADEVPNPIQVTMIGLGPVAENAGAQNLVIQVNGVTDHAITIQYAVDNGGTLTAPRRATFGPTGDLSFPASSSVGGITTVGTATTATVTLPAFTSGFINLPININNDAIYEGQESARIQLLGGPEVSISGGGVAEVVINDDDAIPQVAFLNSAQTVSESNTVQTAIIRLVNGTSEVVAGEDVVITLGSSNNTTNTVVGRTDWTQGLGSITIPAGQSRVALQFSAVMDLVDEDTENFDLTLAALPAGYTSPAGGATHNVSILDVDPAARVNFEVASYAGTAAEATAGALTVNVELDALSERSVVVNYAISGATTSTAACGAGHDISSPNTVTIPPNSTMPFALTTLTLCDDAVYEGDETAVLTITSATNALLGSSLTHSIPIVDDEVPPTLGVTAATTNYDEANTTVTLTIAVAATGKPFTLTYATTGTATVGQDHSLAATGIINVPASTLAQSIPVSFQLVNDSTPENDETIIFTVSAASVDANVVTPAATVTINANDPLQLAVGRRHTCGVLSGRVKCWGYGPVLGAGVTADYGDGAGETVSALQAVALGTGFTPVKVIAGNDFSCALSSAGAVKCWGLNTLGQLGQDRPGVVGQSSEYIGDAASEMGASLPAVQLNATAIDIQTSSNASHACALLSSNRMKCWGLNSSGQLGVAFNPAVPACSNTTVPNTTCQGDDFGDVAGMSFITFPNQSGATVTRMAVGDNHTCAQLSTGVVYCWGDNTNGALGVDSADAIRYLTQAPFASAVLFSGSPFDVSSMVALTAHTNKNCATFLNAGSHVSLCWGEGADGALGQGNTNNAGTVANPLAAVATAIDYTPFTLLTSGVKAGHDYSCLRASSVVAQTLCWGSNAFDQLGSGGGATNDEPTDSTALGPFTDVYVGNDTTCAVSGAFQYTCWGNNSNGNAGAQSGANVTAPGAAQNFL